MKLPSTMLEAHTPLPKLSPAWRNHNVSKIRAAAPETKNRSDRARDMASQRAGGVTSFFDSQEIRLSLRW